MKIKKYCVLNSLKYGIFKDNIKKLMANSEFVWSKLRKIIFIFKKTNLYICFFTNIRAYDKP